jgi:hypothetical protein
MWWKLFFGHPKCLKIILDKILAPQSGLNGNWFHIWWICWWHEIIVWLVWWEVVFGHLKCLDIILVEILTPHIDFIGGWLDIWWNFGGTEQLCGHYGGSSVMGIHNAQTLFLWVFFALMVVFLTIDPIFGEIFNGMKWLCDQHGGSGVFNN